MKSPEGTEIILDTDYDLLFDKVLSMLAATLSKNKLIFEDKVII